MSSEIDMIAGGLTPRRYVWLGPTAAGALATVQELLIPSNARYMSYIVEAAGGPGSSGCVGAPGTIRPGGSAGSGGGKVERFIDLYQTDSLYTGTWTPGAPRVLRGVLGGRGVAGASVGPAQANGAIGSFPGANSTATGSVTGQNVTIYPGGLTVLQIVRGVWDYGVIDGLASCPAGLPGAVPTVGTAAAAGGAQITTSTMYPSGSGGAGSGTGQAGTGTQSTSLGSNGGVAGGGISSANALLTKSWAGPNATGRYASSGGGNSALGANAQSATDATVPGDGGGGGGAAEVGFMSGAGSLGGVSRIAFTLWCEE